MRVIKTLLMMATAATTSLHDSMMTISIDAPQWATILIIIAVTGRIDLTMT